jgi:hypothetical protein
VVLMMIILAMHFKKKSEMKWSWCVLTFKALDAVDISAEVCKSALQGE